MWLVAALAAAVLVLTGSLSVHEAVRVSSEVAPVLAFLAGVTVVAEIADAAGVFATAAAFASRLGRGRTPWLFALVCVLGTLTTIALSLDTTAVLLTPVVLTLAQDSGLSPLPFAFAAVWLANTASLLLPVSNLTNLLAQTRLHTSTLAFAGRLALPEVVAVTLTVVVLAVRFRRDLTGRYAPRAAPPRPDRPLFVLSSAACIAIAPAVLAGAAPWLVTVPAAGVLLLAAGIRQPHWIRPGLAPWRLLILIEALFLIVTAAGPAGLDRILLHAAGSSASPGGVLRTAVTGALASNAVNNLPAYLALQHALTRHPAQLYGLLLGTDLGPLIIVYGSLATLLWRERCRQRGVTVSAAQFARLGAVLVVVLLPGAWLALQVVSGPNRG